MKENVTYIILTHIHRAFISTCSQKCLKKCGQVEFGHQKQTSAGCDIATQARKVTS